MIDKVIKLSDGTTYYILDEVIDNNRQFVFSILCDYEKIKNKYYIFELSVIDGKLNAKTIDEKNILNNMKKLFLERLKG